MGVMEGGSPPAFGPGTILVKQHLDAASTHLGLTVMYKGPEGYAPDSFDWWWGLLDADGAISAGGQIAACLECHGNVAPTGYVYPFPPSEM
jgi:hypothetical protein